MEDYIALLGAVENGVRYVLLSESSEESGWRLPRFAAHSTDLPVALAALRERFGAAVPAIRYTLPLNADGAPCYVAVADLLPARAAIRRGSADKWIAVTVLHELRWAAHRDAELLAAWLRGAGELIGNAATLPWWHEGWYCEAVARLDAVLRGRGAKRTGAAAWVRSPFAGAILRAPTTAGNVTVKAVAPPFAGERTVIRALHVRFPRHLPDIWSGDDAGNELIWADADDAPLSSASPFRHWIQTAQAYARIQAESVPDTALWLARGCYDGRVGTVLQRLPTLATRMERALLPQSRSSETKEAVATTKKLCATLLARLPALQSALERLAGCGVPDALEHGDLQVGSVRWNRAGDTPVFYDWSYPCVTFPFCGFGTLVLDNDWFGADTAALGHVEWAYLSAWAAFASPAALAEAYVTGKRLRFLFHAERQAAILVAFAALWRGADTSNYSPCGDALEQLRRELRSSLRRLVAAYP